jgi:hypothetical protein
MSELRKYGEATTILFPLIARNVVDFNTAATFASGDTKIIKDEGAAANTTNNPAHEGNGIYSLALTATEMQAARIAVTLIDSATKVWEDQAVIIETYGHASAQHALDLDDATLDVNVASIAASAITAAAIATDAIDADAIAAGAIDAAAIANDAIDAAALAADVGTEIAAAVIAALDVNDIADAVLTRALSAVEPAPTARSLYGAAAALTNRRRFNSGNLETFRTDDTTVLQTFARTTDAAEEPTSELNP